MMSTYLIRACAGLCVFQEGGQREAAPGQEVQEQVAPEEEREPSD